MRHRVHDHYERPTIIGELIVAEASGSFNLRRVDALVVQFKRMSPPESADIPPQNA